MAESTASDGDCGICLDALTNPVALPCRHKFCSKCLDSWRSKFGWQGGEDIIGRTCPLCREKILPSREMLSQLKFWRDRVNQIEAKGDSSSPSYTRAFEIMEMWELAVGDSSETIDYADSGDECMTLPTSIHEATRRNDVQTILDWLGPPPLDKRRINAKNPHCLDLTLVMYAAIRTIPLPSEFLSILLQWGADVDAVNAAGHRALSFIKPECDRQLRLLLEWGAEIVPMPAETKDELIDRLIDQGDLKMENLLKSEFGGRRCELVNLSKSPELNGKTGVVEEYLPDKDRYKIVFEASKKAALVQPHNLKRRDRTPTDCGYYITYKKGRYSRRVFATKEECQAYVAELEAKHAAEQLAGLDIKSPKGKSGKKGKKGKKKGRK